VGSLCVATGRQAGTEQELGNCKHEKKCLEQSKQQQQCLEHGDIVRRLAGLQRTIADLI